MLRNRFAIRAYGLASALFALVMAWTASAQTVVETPLPAGRGYIGIVVGADGTKWISEFFSHAILIVKPDKSLIEARTISQPSGPQQMRLGPDGNLWFVEMTSRNIAVMKPDGTMLNEYATRCRPSGALANGSGNVMWFSETCDHAEYITRITMSGTMSQFQIGTDASRNPRGLIEGPDGYIWFVEEIGNAVGRLDPSHGYYAEFSIPTTRSLPNSIFLGPDGNLWFTGVKSPNYILDRIDPSGVITEFDWSGAYLSSLSIGPGNTFWGVDTNKGVWRIDIGSDSIARTAIASRPTSIGGSSLTQDPSGNLWFAQTYGCAVAQIVGDGVFNETFDDCSLAP